MNLLSILGAFTILNSPELIAPNQGFSEAKSSLVEGRVDTNCTLSLAEFEPSLLRVWTVLSLSEQILPQSLRVFLI